MIRRWLTLALAMFGGLTLSVLVVAQISLADQSAQEANLNPGGRVFESNLDTKGNLWISDQDAGEIWQVSSSSGAYTAFQGLTTPSDARVDESGNLWFASYSDNVIGRIDLTTFDLSKWEVDDGVTLFGTAIDSRERAWVAQNGTSGIYIVDPAVPELCEFDLLLGGAVDYMAVDEEGLWLGDWVNGLIYRWTSDDQPLKYWTLPEDSAPENLTLDDDGRLWYSDTNLRQLTVLDSQTDKLIQYDAPMSQLPAMLSTAGGWVLYSDHLAGKIGLLDSRVAIGNSSILTTTTFPFSPSCSGQNPSTTSIVSTTGTLNWTSQVYTTVVSSDGWQLFDLPSGALPWGVATDGRKGWFVDSGRQVLGEFTFAASILGCKVEDDDGNINTDDDRELVQDWPIYLTIDGIAQESPRLTSENGCTEFAGLPPGPEYGLLESPDENWYALTPVTVSFGLANAGDQFDYTFINSQFATITACKQGDGDGKLETTQDRIPLDNWPVYLTINDSRQTPNEATGKDGCFNWKSIEPGITYGVGEEILSGWKALTATSYDFGLAAPGGEYKFTFINTLDSSKVQRPLYLPILPKK